MKITKGTPVVVFNPMSWERTDLAAVRLPEGDTNRYSIFDANGKEIPSQTVVKGLLEREVLFVDPKIPSFGYRTFELRKKRFKGRRQ